jgi:hypothetical protein
LRDIYPRGGFLGFDDSFEEEGDCETEEETDVEYCGDMFVWFIF